MNDETYTAGEMTNAEIGMKEFAEMEKRPQYFSLFLETCETLSLFDNESAGKVMRAIADYFLDGDTPEALPTFTKPERRAYNRIKRGCDESCMRWYATSTGGKEGALKRWANKPDG